MLITGGLIGAAAGAWIGAGAGFQGTCWETEDGRCDRVFKRSRQLALAIGVLVVFALWQFPSLRPSHNEMELHAAASRGNVRAAAKLLDEGAKIDYYREQRALQLAAEQGHVGMLKLLLDRGAGIDREDDMGRTALDSAMKNKQFAAAEFLLEEGASSGSRYGGAMNFGGARLTSGELVWVMAMVERFEIRNLGLWGAGMTDGDLQVLHDMKHLERLNLRGNQLTDEAVADLREALPDCETIWQSM